MSEVQTMGSAPAVATGVRASIARAAQRTGIDFDYLMAQARLESGLNPNARAGTSSAAGLYQFTKGTWAETLGRHGTEHGLGWAEAAIDSGALRDPGTRSQVMALRYDADASALMAAELASDNRATLTPLLGREPDAAELYLAHFLGAGGATRFLAALSVEPGQSAAGLLPQAAAANRAIFYGPEGARSVGAVMDLLRGKVAGAMEGGSMSLPAGEAAENWGQSAGFHVASGAAPYSASSVPAEGPPPPSRPSMADTLRDTFGLGTAEGHSSAPSFVRAAYGNLRSLGL